MSIIKSIVSVSLIFLSCIALLASEPENYPIDRNIYFDDSFHANAVIFDIIVQLPPDTHITTEFLTLEFYHDDSLKLLDKSIIEPIAQNDYIVYKGNVFFQGIFDISPLMDSEQIDIQSRIVYQICEELPFEQCLPPVERLFLLEFQPDMAAGTVDVRTFVEIEELVLTTHEPPADVSAVRTGTVSPVSDDLHTALADNMILALLMIFLAGILTSFTPCVYPMVPITIAVFSKEQGSRWTSFYKSVIYVLGLAATYSILGLISGLTGTLFGSLAQHPVFILIISLLLFFMALSMFGVFDIQVPGPLQDRLCGTRASGLIGIFLLGMVFGLVAAPCAGPIVITLLTYIAATQSPFLGFVLLFVYALGIGVLLIIIGTFSGMLSSMPRAGEWMVPVKHLFGYLILIIIVFFASPLIGSTASSYSYGFLIMLTAVFFFRELYAHLNDTTLKNISITIGLVLLLVSLNFFVRPVLDNTPLFLTGTQEDDVLHWHKDINTGIIQAKEQNLPLLIDFTADWCTYCKLMERTTFRHPEVVDALKDYVLIKVDLTRIDDKNRQIMTDYSIRGLPMIIIYDKDQNELLRIDQFADAQTFLGFIGKL